MNNIYRTGFVSLAVLLAVGMGLYAAVQIKAPTGPAGDVSITVTTRMSTIPIPIAARAGSQFVITIPSNRTTGFQWRMGNKPGAAVKFVGSGYAAPSGGMVGQGGLESWTFRAVSKGTAIISMEYARPWEKNAKPGKVQAFSVTVQ